MNSFLIAEAFKALKSIMQLISNQVFNDALKILFFN